MRSPAYHVHQTRMENPLQGGFRSYSGGGLRQNTQPIGNPRPKNFRKIKSSFLLPKRKEMKMIEIIEDFI